MYERTYDAEAGQACLTLQRYSTVNVTRPMWNGSIFRGAFKSFCNGDVPRGLLEFLFIFSQQGNDDMEEEKIRLLKRQQ